ncbi:hypothetical protein XIS1_250002 [Xenorhabdus innexi]|uniref:Uncharacterized protein n=1 Tax=Xenorhabdus innexi TaxID=290109 RepID=A0A1N6MXB8_9GAMM|nr:hypothetical protein XIS1_250002 [Xenorhabdus innexi]
MVIETNGNKKEKINIKNRLNLLKKINFIDTFLNKMQSFTSALTLNI